MKRLSIILLIPLFLLGAGRLPAQLQVSFDPPTANVNVGDDVTIDLIAEDNFDMLAGLEFTMTFDETQLQFVDAYPLVDTTSFANFKGLDVAYIPPGNPTFGSGVKVTYFDLTLNGKTLADGTAFIRVILKAVSPGSSQFKVTCDANRNCEIIQAPALNNIGINNLAPANITVIGSFDGVVVEVDDVSAGPGSQVCVPVRAVEGFTNIGLMEFGLTWDESIVTFSSLANCNSTLGLDCSLPLPNANFGFFNSNTLQLSWINPFGGETLMDGEVLFEVCFDVVGQVGEESPVDFFANPNPSLPPRIEFRDGSDNIVQSQTLNGSVSVINDVNLIVDPADLDVCEGDTVCIPITVTDFTQMTGVQLYFATDPTKLNLLSVQNCHPDLDLPNCSIGNLTFNEVNDVLGFLFEDPNPLDDFGVTLDSGAVMFELCYENLMSEGESDTLNVIDNGLLLSEANDTSGLIGLIRLPGIINTVACDCDLNVAAAITTKVTCPGGSDGAINLLVNGGSGDFTYTWDPVLPNTKNPQDLTAGTYRVTITDNQIANCIWESNDIIVTEPDDITITLVEVVNETCSGTMDGSIELDIEGGNTGNYTVNWGAGVGVGNPIENLSGGSYTATVTDSKGCSAVGPEVEVMSSSLVVTFMKEDVTCFGADDGSITLTLPPSGEPYTVTWDPSSVGPGTSITGLGPGQYLPTIMDKDGCMTVPEPITIFEPTDITVSGQVTDNDCANGNDGAIDLSAAGGTGNLTYQWNDGSDDMDRTGLAADTWSVTVTDENGCTKSALFEVEEPGNPINITFTKTNTVLGQSTGSIDITVSGGTPDYTYLWNPGGEVTQDLVSLGVGTYTVTVTDANGCTAIQSITINAAADTEVTFEVEDYDGFDVSCFGTCDGIVIAFPPNAAVEPLQFDWAGGPTDVSNEATALLTDLCPGMYTVTITDANNQKYTGSVMLQGPPSWSLDLIVDGTPPPDASVFVDIVGNGIGPFTYDWNTGDTQPFLANLEEGEYCVTVTNARGCEMTSCVEIFDVDCLLNNQVITPNGDGQNDRFIISCIEDDRYANHRLEIYNRWGQIIFSTTNYQNNWMGTSLAGTELPEGAYYYVLEYLDIDGEFKVLKGDITLLR